MTESSLHCSKCLLTLNRDEISYLLDEDNFLQCICKNKLNIKNILIGKPKEELNLDFNNLMRRPWFHSTDLINWFDNVKKDKEGKGLYVHLGNEKSTFERAGSRYFTDNLEKFIVYKVEFTPEAKFCPVIEEDKNESFDYLDPSKSDKAALFYKNRWENPGSISVVANPHFLRVIDSYLVTISDLRQKRLITLLDLTSFTNKMIDTKYRIIR